MPDQNAPQTYGAYIDGLWEQMERGAEPRTLSRLIAAEACWMQVPDAEAAAAQPDLAAIDGWAEKIEGTKAFGRMMDSPALPERIAKRDAEGLMTELHSELTARSRDRPAEPELALATEQRQPQKAPREPPVPAL